jgi:hypothetical protein
VRQRRPRILPIDPIDERLALALAESRRIRQESWTLSLREQLWQLRALLSVREARLMVLRQYGLNEERVFDPAGPPDAHERESEVRKSASG